ncbi:MAG: ABC transporter transmembrane domain-containing protein, partial [Oscillospiraceae bacterium]
MSNQSKKESIMSMLKSRYVRDFFKKYRFYYFWGIFFLVIIDYSQTVIPLVTGEIIDGYKNGALTINNVWPKIIYIVIFAAVIIVGRMLWRHFIFGTSRKIERDMRNDIFLHLEKLSLTYYNKHKTGEIMSYVTNDLESVRNAMGQGMMMLFDVVALGTFTIYNMVSKINITLTIAAIIPLLLISLTAIILGPKMFRRYFNRQESFSQMSDFVQEDLSGIKVIKAFTQEKQQIDAFKNVNDDYFDKNIKLMKLEAAMHPIMSSIAGFALAIAIGFGGYLAVNKTITLGDFSAFIEYLGMLVWPMMAIGMVINIITRGSASLKRIESVLAEIPEIKDDAETVLDIDKYDGSIEVKNLNYKYPNTDEYVLKDMSFSIKKGETLGIVARTGSGKTTLINLFLRLYNVDRGTVFIGGHDILDIPLKVLRENIGYVP